MKRPTTAANLWTVAAIGPAIGGGPYVPAVATTTFVVAILAGVKSLEERWRDRMQTRTFRFVAKRGTLPIDTLHAATGERAPRVRKFVTRPAEDPALDEIDLAFARLSATSEETIAETLHGNPDVVSVETARRSRIVLRRT